MFTGIVSERGRVAAVRRLGRNLRVRLHGPRTARGLTRGASVAVDGICLTVVALAKQSTKTKKGNPQSAIRNPQWFEVDVVPETLRRTVAGRWVPGTRVNLERALRMGDELSGHLVLGHVDGTGRVLRLDRNARGVRLTVKLHASLMRSVPLKGSVTVNGVSLTVAGRTATAASMALIPVTLRETTLGDLRPGDIVNIEVDVLARYLNPLNGKGWRRAGLALKAALRPSASSGSNR